jgi:hypothetical protein
MDWLKTIGSLAPTVATALGGPLTGVAVAALGKALGLDSPTEDKVANIIASGKLTPEQLSAIKLAELDFQKHESDIGFKYTELEFKDKDSARNLTIQTKSITPEALSWLIIALGLGAEVYVLFHGIPNKVSDMVAGRILGTLDAAVITVISFWLGSSVGSRNKDNK